MKKLATVLLVLLLAVLGAPFFAGMKAKQELDQVVAYLSSQPGYQLELVDYHRGWLKSRAKLVLQSAALRTFVSQFPAEITKPTIPIELALNHGPLILTDGFKLGWFSGISFVTAEPQSVLAVLLNQPPDTRLGQVNFLMDLFGNVHFNDRSVELSLQLDEETVEAAAYAGQGTLTRDGRLNYAAVLPSVSLRDPQTEVVLENLEIKAEIHLNALSQTRVFAPGVIEFSVSTVSGLGEGINDFSLKGLRIVSDNALAGEAEALANMSVSVTFDELSLEDNLIEQFHSQLILERISLAFLNQYAEGMAALNGADGSVSPMGLDVLGLITQQLLPAGPRINLEELSFKSEKGDLSFNAQAYLADQNNQAVTNPFLIFQALVVDAEFAADRSLVLEIMTQSAKDSLADAADEQVLSMSEEQRREQASEQASTRLDLFLLQGFFLQNDGKITAKFSFADGTATLNGKPMPMPF